MFSNTMTNRLSMGLFCILLSPVFYACNLDGTWAGQILYHQDPAHIEVVQTINPNPNAVDLAIADAREADLVEQMVEFRSGYVQSLKTLKSFYDIHGSTTKSKWANFELDGLRGVRKFRYLMDAEVASDTLRPLDNIAEANTLYEKGLGLMQQGGHGVPGLFRRDRMIEAAEVFRDMIALYPSSDKIDDAAFYCGEIHKEYLPNQAEIAVKWYERAWTWNPQIERPARFQAAVVYDYRLQDRSKALELYQSAVKLESDHASNVRFAVRRIQALSGTASGAFLAAP